MIDIRKKIKIKKNVKHRLQRVLAIVIEAKVEIKVKTKVKVQIKKNKTIHIQNQIQGINIIIFSKLKKINVNKKVRKRTIKRRKKMIIKIIITLKMK